MRRNGPSLEGGGGGGGVRGVGAFGGGTAVIVERQREVGPRESGVVKSLRVARGFEMSGRGWRKARCMTVERVGCKEGGGGGGRGGVGRWMRPLK